MGNRETSLLGQTAAPELVSSRLAALREDGRARSLLARFSEHRWRMLLAILDLSDFLFRFLCRHPEDLLLLGATPVLCPEAGADPVVLRRWKYRRLLQLTALDLAGRCPFVEVVGQLTALAGHISTLAHDMALQQMVDSGRAPAGPLPLASLALGKLGAGEINYSSDIDLLFVCDNSAARSTCYTHIRHFVRILEQSGAEGFLYRVDLNLRPWGRHAPMVLGIDATENYYAGSREAWERLAWLRARPLTGCHALARDLLARLVPFVYHRSLGFEDIQRFVAVKKAMAKQRQRPGQWNIKTGQGGIRDIEFFVQLLQILNGGQRAALRKVNTLEAMDALLGHDLIDAQQHQALRQAYVFLRTLEHRVQMVDEKQTHVLPVEPGLLLRVACAMDTGAGAPGVRLERFQAQLARHRQTAQHCFEELLESTS